MNDECQIWLRVTVKITSRPVRRSDSRLNGIYQRMGGCEAATVRRIVCDRKKNDDVKICSVPPPVSGGALALS